MRPLIARSARALLATAALLGAVAAHATDPATSPFAADRYDYSVQPTAKAPAKATTKCHDGKAACHPSR